MQGGPPKLSKSSIPTEVSAVSNRAWREHRSISGVKEASSSKAVDNWTLLPRWIKPPALRVSSCWQPRQSSGAARTHRRASAGCSHKSSKARLEVGTEASASTSSYGCRFCCAGAGHHSAAHPPAGDGRQQDEDARPRRPVSAACARPRRHQDRSHRGRDAHPHRLHAAQGWSPRTAAVARRLSPRVAALHRAACCQLGWSVFGWWRLQTCSSVRACKQAADRSSHRYRLPLTTLWLRLLLDIIISSTVNAECTLLYLLLHLFASVTILPKAATGHWRLQHLTVASGGVCAS